MFNNFGIIKYAMIAFVARLTVIDAVKSVVSELILHIIWRPTETTSDALQQVTPRLISWLYDYEIMAVQLFFVIGGYWAALVMLSEICNTRAFVALIFNRYLWLVVTLCSGGSFFITCAIVAQQQIVDDCMPEAPTISSNYHANVCRLFILIQLK